MPLSDIQLQFVQRYLTKQLPVPTKVAPLSAPAVENGKPETAPTTYKKGDIEGLLRSVAEFRKQVEILLGGAHAGLTKMADEAKQGFEAAATIEDEPKFQTAMTKADKVIDAAFVELTRLAEARETYLADLPQAETLLTALKAHPKFSTVEQVKV